MTSPESDQRRDQIVAHLKRHDELSAAALARMLGVTVQTIRTDLRMLDEARVIRRRHGAARLNTLTENLAYQPRQDVAREEKARIARAAAALIPEGATVAIGPGTTAEALAHALAAHRGLVVATNNLHVALALRAAPDVTVMLAGGTLRLHYLDVSGADAQGFFEGLNFDVAVMSVGGCAADGALLDYSPAEIQARRALTRCARQKILLMDQGKIGKPVPFAWGSCAEADTLITDAPLPPDLDRLTRAGGCRILLA